MKKFAILLLSLALTAVSVIGCANQASNDSGNETQENNAPEGEQQETPEAASDEPDLNGTNIVFWHSMGGVNGEAVTYLVDKFNEENEFGITVEAQYQGSYDDAINKLKSAKIGNMGADLVQIYDIGTRFMIDSGWVVPMQELIDKDGWDIAQVEPNIAAYYSIDNQLYSMPFNSSTPLLYYNKDIFEKAGVDSVPESLPQIESVSEKLMNEGGAQEAISLAIYGWFFEQFTCKQGLHYVDNGNGREDKATAVEFDSNGAGKNILEAWNSLAQKGYAPNIGRGGDAGVADFVAGKSAMTLASTANLKQILIDVDGKFEVGTAYFPKVKDSDEGGVSIGGASLWALDNKDDAKKAATWEFVKFLASPESQAYWNTQTGYFPITVAAHDEPVFKENIEKYPQFQTAIDQLHDTAPEYAGALLSVFPEARAIVETNIENMLNGVTDADGAVKAMADDINKSIENYNLINK